MMFLRVQGATVSGGKDCVPPEIVDLELVFDELFLPEQADTGRDGKELM